MTDDRDIRLLRVVIKAQREMITEREEELRGLKTQLTLWEEELEQLTQGQLIKEGTV